MSLARFALADLRAAWRQWVGAFVVLVTTAAALTCAVAIVVTADTLPARGPFPMNISLGSLAGMNAGIVAVVGVVMVRNVVDQIVAQRRRAMAAWMLVGLLPRQAAIVVASPGVVVAMAAAVASTPLGVGAAYLALGALAGTVGAPAPPLVARPSALILPVLLLLGVTLLALRRPCRRAIRVDPALALRDDVDVEARRLSVWRVIIALLAAAGSVVGVAAAASAAQPDAAGGAVLGVLAAAALLLSALGPVLAVGVHRAWTALLPDRLVGWWLARSALTHTPQRIASVSVPIALVGLLPGGVQMLTDSMRDSQIASSGRATASGASLRDLLMVALLPSGVALVGASMALFMGGQRRDGELAATALVGATPGAQLRQVAAEALSVAATGALLGMAALAIVGVAIRQLLVPVFPVAVLTFPSTGFGLSILLATAICLVASLAPTLPMLMRPPHRAQLALGD